MKMHSVILISLLVPIAAGAGATVLRSDPPKACAACAAWNAVQEPFRIFGNTYDVGVAGLSSVLIASDKSLILLDGGLPQSAPLIDASLRKLGFRTENLRLTVKRVKVVADGETLRVADRTPDPRPHPGQHDLDLAILRSVAVSADRLRRQSEPRLCPRVSIRRRRDPPEHGSHLSPEHP